VKVDGIELLTYSEVLDSLKIESSVDSSQVQLNEWAEKLESQPRVQSAQLKVEGGYLLVKIQEKPIDWVVQSGGKLYELDGSLKIVSMDDVRSKWIPILSGNFRTTETNIEGSLFLSMIQQANRMFRLFPELKQRISEINVDKDGGILVYLHHPTRMTVQMGFNISTLQAKKLYASVAYFEGRNIYPKLMDLRGEDAFYY
jgi:hypothetical protein